MTAVSQAAETARWGAVAAVRLIGGAEYVLRDAPQRVVEALASRCHGDGRGAAAGLLDAIYDAASVEQKLRRAHHALMGKVRAT